MPAFLDSPVARPHPLQVRRKVGQQALNLEQRLVNLGPAYSSEPLRGLHVWFRGIQGKRSVGSWVLWPNTRGCVPDVQPNTHTTSGCWAHISPSRNGLVALQGPAAPLAIHPTSATSPTSLSRLRAVWSSCTNGCSSLCSGEGVCV